VDRISYSVPCAVADGQDSSCDVLMTLSVGRPLPRTVLIVRG